MEVGQEPNRGLRSAWLTFQKPGGRLAAMTSEADISYFTAKRSWSLRGSFLGKIFPPVFFCASLKDHWFLLKESYRGGPVFSAYGFAGLAIYYDMPQKCHFFLFPSPCRFTELFGSAWRLCQGHPASVQCKLSFCSTVKRQELFWHCDGFINKPTCGPPPPVQSGLRFSTSFHNVFLSNPLGSRLLCVGQPRYCPLAPCSMSVCLNLAPHYDTSFPWISHFQSPPRHKKYQDASLPATWYCCLLPIERPACLQIPVNVV